MGPLLGTILSLVRFARRNGAYWLLNGNVSYGCYYQNTFVKLACDLPLGCDITCWMAHGWQRTDIAWDFSCGCCDMTGCLTFSAFFDLWDMYVLGEQKLTRSQCKAKDDSVAQGCSIYIYTHTHRSKELAFAQEQVTIGPSDATIQASRKCTHGIISHKAPQNSEPCSTSCVGQSKQIHNISGEGEDCSCESWRCWGTSSSACTIPFCGSQHAWLGMFCWPWGI